MTVTTDRTKVFVSYSHADKRWLKRLQVHLAPLWGEREVLLWDDSQIQAGDDWQSSIDSNLKATRIAILLVSADFLASRFIQKQELPPLLAAAEDGGATIIPIILKPCRFSKTPSLARFQAANSPDRPLSSLDHNAQEAVFADVAERVARLLEKPLNAPFPVPVSVPVPARGPESETALVAPVAGSSGPRTAVIVAAGLLAAGALWFALTRNAQPANPQVTDGGGQDSQTGPDAPKPLRPPSLDYTQILGGTRGVCTLIGGELRDCTYIDVGACEAERFAPTGESLGRFRCAPRSETVWCVAWPTSEPGQTGGHCSPSREACEGLPDSRRGDLACKSVSVPIH